MTEFDSQAHCICGSGKRFGRCCGRFLKGDEQAKTPEQLMRSRYAAYALGGHGEYLLATWFAPMTRGLAAEALSEKTVDWVKLEVLGKSQKGDSGTVEFRAWFREPEQDALQAMHELSTFQRTGGRWFYVGGEVGAEVDGLASD